MLHNERKEASQGEGVGCMPEVIAEGGIWRGRDLPRSQAAMAPAVSVGGCAYIHFVGRLLRLPLGLGVTLGALLAAATAETLLFPWTTGDDAYIKAVLTALKVAGFFVAAFVGLCLPVACYYRLDGHVLRTWACDLVVCCWLLILLWPVEWPGVAGQLTERSGWTRLGIAWVPSFLSVVFAFPTIILIDLGLHILDDPLLCWPFARPKRRRQWCDHWLPRWRAASVGLVVACPLLFLVLNFSTIMIGNVFAAAVCCGVRWTERGRIRDGPSWVRCRAAQVAQYLHLRRFLCWKLDTRMAARGLLEELQRLQADITLGSWQVLNPKYWLKALCPSKRVRRTIARVSGIRLSTSGYHESMVQELTWSRGILIMLSAAAAIPFFAGWMYQRQNPPRAFLSENLPDRAFNVSDFLRLGTGVTDAQRIDLQIKIDSSYNSFSPVVGGDLAEDGDPLPLTCPGKDKFAGFFWAGVKVKEEYNFWSDMQLVCYCGYVLVCLFLIWLESDENIQLAVSCKLNAVYDPERSSKQRYRVTQLVVIIVIVILGIIFVRTLTNNNFDEAFMVFASTGLQVADVVVHWDNIDNDFHLYFFLNGDRKELRFRLPQRAKMIGLACSPTLPADTAVLLIYHDDLSADDLGFGVFQGILFLGGLFSLYWAQSRKYDFINLDQYLKTLSGQRCVDEEHRDAHEEDKESMSDCVEDCPYAAFLRNIHENPFRIGRKEVTQYLYEEVDLPFLRAVEQEMPGLFYEIMNENEADEILRHVQGRAEVMVEQTMEEGDSGNALINTRSE